MKRASGIRESHHICFPGGHYDSSQDSTLASTALRETVEEIGICPSRLQVWGPQPGIHDWTMTGKVVGYAGEITGNLSLDDLKINRSEVSKAYAIPVSSLIDKNNHTVRMRRYTESNQLKYLKPFFGTDELPELHYSFPEMPDATVWGLTAVKLNFLLHYTFETELNQFFHKFYVEAKHLQKKI